MRKLLALALSTALSWDGALAQGNTDAEPFLARCAALAKQAEADKLGAVVGADGWLFVTGELRHLGLGEFWGDKAAAVSRAAKPENADPLAAIVDFNDQLRTAGVELIVVPVPPQAIIHPETVPGQAAMKGAGRLDPYHQAFYQLLRSKGVAIVDLVPTFREHAQGNGSPIFCQQDSHWSGTACVIAAGVLAADIKQKGWFGAVPKTKFTSENREITIQGDLLDHLPPQVKSRFAPEKLTVRFVGLDRQRPVPPDPASPVLLLGDSHTLFLHAGGDMQAAGAGLADQLALELGFAVDVIGVRGSGATPARVNLLRKARATPGYLQGKKLVIWCFAAREFTESDGWAKVPIMPK